MLFAADGSLDPVAVLKLLGALGFLGATGVVLLVLARKAPPLTTQRNLQTGMTEHGIVTWAAWFYGLMWVLPWTIALVAEHPPLLGFVAFVLVVCALGVWKWRNRKTVIRQDRVPPAVTVLQPAPQVPACAPQPPNPDWDQTRYMTPFYPPQQPPDEYWQRPTNGTPIL